MSDSAVPGADLRIGVIGLDTSHCVAFAQVLNDPGAANHVPGARIVAAVKTWSADVEASASRIEGRVLLDGEELEGGAIRHADLIGAHTLSFE